MPGTYFYCYDGNGNVAALVDAANGTIAANYWYGPFGELIGATGPLAFINPFLFSTKYRDLETGFYDYGHRYYNPSSGRWPNSDPIQENGGINLYKFVRNQPITHYDSRGLYDSPGSFSPNACYQAQLAADNAMLKWMASQDIGDLFNYLFLEAVADSICNGPPPPSPIVCPLPTYPTRQPSAPPHTQSFCSAHPWACVGVGVGIGIAVGCTLCPECCVITIIIGASPVGG